MKEIDILKSAYGIYLDENNIDEWIGVEVSDYYDESGYVSTLTSCIEYAKKVLGMLGYDMIVKQKGEISNEK